MPPIAFAIAGLVLSVVGTAVQFQSAKKARKQAKRQFAESNALRRQAEEKQQKVADLQTLRAKRATAREAQRTRADIIQGAVTRGAGATGGSTVPGARGSITSQLTSNLSFLDRANQLNTQTVALLGQAAEVNASIFTSTIGSSIAGFGGTIFDNSEKLSSLFKTS